MFNRMKDSIYRIIRSRGFVLIVAFCILSAILINRLFYLQIVRGEDYLNNYKLQIMKTRQLSGTRGKIYDRNGNLLAYNELAYSVTIEDNISSDTPLDEKNVIMNEIIEQVLTIVEEHGDSVISDFGIILDAAGNYVFSASDSVSRLRFLADVYGYANIDSLSDQQRNSTPDDVIHYLCTDENYGYGIDESMEKTYVLKLVNMRYAIGLNSYQQYIPTTLASDVSDETVSAIMENMDHLDGVDIAEDSLRRYTGSQYFASIIGYTGKISQEEYDALDSDQKKSYALTDVVGKAGLEQTMDETLQGAKGEVNVYVDALGKVTETVSKTDPSAGNDVYLTIDKDLQEQTYHLIEEKLAAIVLSKMSNTMNYDPTTVSDASQLIIPIDDVYFAFIGNNIVDYNHFPAEDAGQAEKAIYAAFEGRKATAVSEVVAEIGNPSAAAYEDLSSEMKAYMDYVTDDLLTTAVGILMADEIDTTDATYQAWTSEENISLYSYLNYAISKNWIDTSKLSEYIPDSMYSDSNEVFQGIISFLTDYLQSDSNFDTLLYQYLIKSEGITGEQICATVYEQGILPMDEENYNGLLSGSVEAYDWVRAKLGNLEITPGQLALEPCTGSAVVTDVNTGQVLACVSYPGYDNNRLANTMDSRYYNQLVTGLSRPLYNNATQEKTAPGSTYKMLTSVAALTEKQITADTVLSCTGEFTAVTPSPKCWIYPGAHGGLNVVSAITQSCNCFYYQVGYDMGTTADGSYSSDQGVHTLAKYAEEFGLGETSGLEIPESEPQISDEASVPTAIGQGTNNYTVSQLNRYVTAVANRGTVYDLTLLNRVTDSDGNLIREFQPEVVNEMDDVSDKTWDLVQQGMVGMVANTASFSGMGMAMAGKTGTAQQSLTHPDHALFVGYAPAEKPEISIAVRIANGYYSNYVAEIGRDIVKCRYGLDEIDNIISGGAASLGTASHGD